MYYEESIQPIVELFIHQTMTRKAGSPFQKPLGLKTDLQPNLGLNIANFAEAELG